MGHEDGSFPEALWGCVRWLLAWEELSERQHKSEYGQSEKEDRYCHVRQDGKVERCVIDKEDWHVAKRIPSPLLTLPIPEPCYSFQHYEPAHEN